MRTREKYNDSIHTLGRTTNFIAIILMIMVPVAFKIYTGTEFDTAAFIQHGLPLIIIYSIVGVTEIFSYTPVLGAGGTYITFITGNISNMKLPSSIAAQEAINAKKGSEEADIASTLAIATSSFVTVTVLIIGLIGFSFFKEVLENELLAPGFANVLPALMGAFATPFMMKSPKKALIAIVFILFYQYVLIPMAPTKIGGILPAFTVFFSVIVTVGVSYIIFKNTKEKAN